MNAQVGQMEAVLRCHMAERALHEENVVETTHALRERYVPLNALIRVRVHARARACVRPHMCALVCARVCGGWWC